MSDNSSETMAAVDTKSQGHSSQQLSATLRLGHILNFCAFIVIAAFFMPWIRFLGITRSGFDFAKEGGNALALWIIPLLSFTFIIANQMKASPRVAAQLAGAAPFALFAYTLYENGEDLFKLLTFGAYICLCGGLLLFVLGRRA